MIKTYLIAYIATLLSYLALDGLWLGVIAKDSYRRAMQGLLREDFPVAPWVTFYLLYCAVIVYLVILPNLTKSWLHVACAGAALGLAAYGAYNLTNYAIIKDWPLGITLKDWVWGTLLTAIGSLSGYFAAQHFVKTL